MAKYRIYDFVRTGEVYIDPEIQSRNDFPFTIEHAQLFFDQFATASFEFNGIVRSIFIYDGKESLPDPSYAKGYLFSYTCDALAAYAKRNEGYLPRNLGSIYLEYGGAHSRPSISIKKREDEEKAEGIRELKTSELPSGEIAWHCLHCEGRITEEDLKNWKCPACRHLNPEPLNWVRCEQCRFSAEYFACPHCSLEFDMLLFSHTQFFEASMAQRLSEIGISISESARQEINDLKPQGWGTLWAKILDIHFELPVTMNSGELNSYHQSEHGRHWFHFWLFTSSKRSQNVAAYMSVAYPGMKPDDKDKATALYLHLKSHT